MLLHHETYIEFSFDLELARGPEATPRNVPQPELEAGEYLEEVFLRAYDRWMVWGEKLPSLSARPIRRRRVAVSARRGPKTPLAFPDSFIVEDSLIDPIMLGTWDRRQYTFRDDYRRPFTPKTPTHDVRWFGPHAH